MQPDNILVEILMKILLTNDDGIGSALLSELANELSSWYEVQVSAPESEQSGVGHGFTFNRVLPVKKDQLGRLKRMTIKGTPADCVKFAICNDSEKPDFVISGPNNGENTGVATAYSGTLAGAREAALWGVPSLAISLQVTNEPTRKKMLGWILRFIKEKQFANIKKGTFWSVNFPDIEEYPNAETIWCSQSLVMYEDQYLQIACDPNSVGYMLSGYKPRNKFVLGTDDEALYNGKITISPLTLDQTDYAELNRLSKVFFKSMNQNV